MNKLRRAGDWKNTWITDLGFRHFKHEPALRIRESTAPWVGKSRVPALRRGFRPCWEPKAKRTCSEHHQEEKQLYGTDSGLDEITRKVTRCLHYAVLQRR